MKTPSTIATAAARLLAGAGFTLFGANALFDFLPHPDAAPPAEAGALLGALAASGYVVPLLGATMLAAGVLLLANRLVPLALVLLAPILVNILAFHLVLAPAGIVPGAVLAALTAALAWAHRAAYRPLFSWSRASSSSSWSSSWSSSAGRLAPARSAG